MEMKKYVLVVDDNAINRECLKRRLEKEFECTVYTAESVFEARNCIVTHGWPKLIISDTDMPNEDGISFLTWVRLVMSSDTPFVLVSNDMSDERRSIAVKQGAGATLALSKEELLIQLGAVVKIIQ